MDRKTLVFAALLVSACAPDDRAYTLYRASPLDSNMRIHVASFDTNESAAYNSENCLLAEKLLNQQPGVTVRFWCEKGRFRK